MLSNFMRDLLDDTSGATAIEYGLIVALMAIAALVAIRGFAGSTIEMWDGVSTRVVNAISK